MSYLPLTVTHRPLPLGYEWILSVLYNKTSVCAIIISLQTVSLSSFVAVDGSQLVDLALKAVLCQC